jgi:hypothetical protein
VEPVSSRLIYRLCTIRSHYSLIHRQVFSEYWLQEVTAPVDRRANGTLAGIEAELEGEDSDGDGEPTNGGGGPTNRA